MNTINELPDLPEFTFQVNLAIRDEYQNETTITHVSVAVTTTDEDDARVQALGDLFESGFAHWFEVESVEVLS